MRVLMAMIVSASILGGMAAYMKSKKFARVATKPAKVDPQAKGVFGLEVMTSFTAEPDPFGPKFEDTEAPPAILVRLAGKEILRITDHVPAGKPIKVEPVAGFVVGANELYLLANPPIEQGNRAHSIRVRVLRDGRQVAEKTFWSEPGTPLAETFELTIPADRNVTADRKDDHDH